MGKDKTNIKESTSSLAERNGAEIQESRTDLIDRARAGDSQALVALQEKRTHGDSDFQTITGRHLETTLIQKLSKGDQLVRLLLEDDQARIRAELVDTGATGLEKVLAEQIAIGMLAANYYETANISGQIDSPKVFELRLKRVEMIHRRVQTAIKNLALIRKLKVPAAAVQVNVSQQSMLVAEHIRE